MMRCCIWLLLMPLLGTAQKFTAADMKQLKMYSAGVFTNEVQAAADTHFVRSLLSIQPIWQKRKDGLWMFAERTDTGRNYQVWHYYLQDDSTLVMQFFDFKEKEKALMLVKDIKQQTNLFLYNLFTRHGCEVYLKNDKTGFKGSTTGKECFTSIPGAEYLVLNITIAREILTWQQLTFDKQNNEMPVIPNGMYKYIKTRNLKPAKSTK